MSDNLGDRIKRYERAYNLTLTPRTPVMIRVDGRAFHTYTKSMERPFCEAMMDAMVWAAKQTATNMMAFKLAYTQSDECTFLITDYDKLTSEGWFGYELNKIVSISASLFTNHFNWYMQNRQVEGNGIAVFDARAFNIPEEDAPNAFIWRQRDWERNSLQMLARHHFSHKELHNKGRREMHDMLHGIGVNWANLTDQQKNGTWILRDGTLSHERLTYPEIKQLMDSNETETVGTDRR